MSRPIVTPYERRQIEAVREWKNREPALLSRMMHDTTKRFASAGRVFRSAARLLRPIGELARRLAIPAAARNLGRFNRWLADRWTSRRRLLRKLKVGSFEEVRQLPLEPLDLQVRSVRTWATGSGAVVGAAGGAAGFVVGFASMAAVIHVATRTVRQIGLCYGYEARDELENHFVVQVLALASATSHAEKATALTTLAQIQKALLRKSWKAMAGAGRG